MPDLEVDDVVQLGPETNFPYCFMVVTDPKAWGAQGYIYMPQKLGEKPSEAYYRAKHEDMTYIGRAEWLPRPVA